MSPDQTPPSATEIIQIYLNANGFHGLKCNQECHCTMDRYLSCQSFLDNCEPGNYDPSPKAPSQNFIIFSNPNTKPAKEPSQ